MLSGAVVMAWASQERVHSVYLMNVEQCQVAANPQTKPTIFFCESAFDCLTLHPPYWGLITRKSYDYLTM